MGVVGWNPIVRPRIRGSDGIDIVSRCSIQVYIISSNALGDSDSSVGLHCKILNNNIGAVEVAPRDGGNEDLKQK